MGRMEFIGVEERAKQARSALNRLRWEVDSAIEQGRVNDAASMDLAEAVAIMAHITQALDEHLPAQPEDELQQVLGSARERFAEHLAFYFRYHEVAR
jgi:molybdopterin-binding protein